MTTHRKIRGFTLIEILVVVAIVALLVSILLPSLARAREMAKITTCKVNSRQIAINIAMYQADARGFVPVMFNYYSNGVAFSNAGPGQPQYAPARTCWLSLALRMYDKGTAHLPSWLPSPDMDWDNAQRQSYEDKVMPEYYACPFSRGNGDGKVWKRTVQIGTTTYDEYDWEGRHDLYQTWKWDGLVVHNRRANNAAGALPLYPGDPGGPVQVVDGRPKYSALCWNKIRPQDFPEYRPFYSGFANASDDIATINLHRNWTSADTRRVLASGFSDVSIAFCAQGNHLGRGPDRMNPNSHRTSAGPGTNVIFADSHVEWVKGTRVGWP